MSFLSKLLVRRVMSWILWRGGGRIRWVIRRHRGLEALRGRRLEGRRVWESLVRERLVRERLGRLSGGCVGVRPLLLLQATRHRTKRPL